MPERSGRRISTALTFGMVFLTTSVSVISSSPGRMYARRHFVSLMSAVYAR